MCSSKSGWGIIFWWWFHNFPLHSYNFSGARVECERARVVPIEAPPYQSIKRIYFDHVVPSLNFSSILPTFLPTQLSVPKFLILQTATVSRRASLSQGNTEGLALKLACPSFFTDSHCCLRYQSQSHDGRWFLHIPKDLCFFGGYSTIS